MNIHETSFMRACMRQPVAQTPVWFMRQAGRSLPEYRKIRERYSFMDISRNPELCAEVTLQPVRRLHVDAAILFADIMTPLIASGVKLELVEHIGPVLDKPIRTVKDLRQIRPLSPEEQLPYIFDAIRLIKQELGAARPLIGFAGAPFTLASYLIEGKGSRAFLHTKRLMLAKPTLWHDLMDRLTEMTIRYLQFQIAAGADVVQLFDSWVGCLGATDYAEFVQPYSRRIIAAINQTSTPFIHFGVGTSALLPLMGADGADVIGVDWHQSLDSAWQQIGDHVAIQGNLDPAFLLAPWDILREKARAVLDSAHGRPGHIFNLGHGIYPETPVKNLIQLVEFVHAYSMQTSEVLVS